MIRPPLVPLFVNTVTFAGGASKLTRQAVFPFRPLATVRVILRAPPALRALAGREPDRSPALRAVADRALVCFVARPRRCAPASPRPRFVHPRPPRSAQTSPYLRTGVLRARSPFHPALPA